MDWDKVEFKNEKRFLSNMWLCNVRFSLTEEEKARFSNISPDDYVYKSTEHIYQAMKSKNPLWHKIIRQIDDSHKTKTLVRKKVKPNLLIETEEEFLFRSDFDDIKLELMECINYLKYKQNIDLRHKLISIQGEIVERNCWGDTFWGTVDGVGENHLGKILMKLREEFSDN